MGAGKVRRSWTELVAARAILLNVLFKQANAQTLTEGSGLEAAPGSERSTFSSPVAIAGSGSSTCLFSFFPRSNAGVFHCGGKEIADCQRTFHFEDSKASLLSSVAGCVGFWSRCGGPPCRALMDSAMRFVFASAFSTLTFTI
jgi:hypothetical protein